MNKKNRNLSEEEIKLIEETERFMEEVNSDPDVANAPLPPQMKENILREIRAREAAKEEKELIRLGTIYKKRRSRRKYFVLAAAVICAMAFGITSIGGADKVFETFKLFGVDRDQTQTNSGDVDVVESVTEEEVYQEIEEKYNFSPVRIIYRPDNVELLQAEMGDEIQGIKMLFGHDDKVDFTYRVRPNYRDGSLGTDIEDAVIDEYSLQNGEVEIAVKQYCVEDGNDNRWSATFIYQNTHYLVAATDMEKVEFEEILKNLYFF